MIREAIAAAGGDASEIPYEEYLRLESMASPLIYFIDYSPGITEAKRKDLSRRVYDIKDKLKDA